MGSVLIVGAGPAGAALARILVERGIDVTLLERQRDFTREFRGEVVMPTGVAALEQICSEGELQRLPQELQTSVSLYFRGRRAFRGAAGPDTFAGRPPRALSQPALLEMLVTRASENSGFSLELGASVKELLYDGDRVTGVRAFTSAGERELHADLVIGADGRTSAVRRRGGFSERHVSVPLDVIWCKLACPEDWDGARAYTGRGHFLICYRSWDGKLQLAWMIEKGTYREFKKQGPETWLAAMEEHASEDLAAHIRNCSEEIGRPFLLDAVSDHAGCWSKPGVLLIGDAAHTMSPVGGQGINIALRDVLVTANHLVPILSGPTDPRRLDEALVAIERERRPEVEEVQRLQAFAPRVGFNSAWWGDPLRWGISRLLALPWVQARAAVDAQPFLFGRGHIELRV